MATQTNSGQVGAPPSGGQASRSPLLSIVIVNYCSGRLLRQCLDSIRENTQAAHEVWVIDNASWDGSAQGIESGTVKLIRNAGNVGFAKATNQGIRASAAEMILLVNPDTVVRAGAIDSLLAYLQTRAEVGIAGCRVLNEDGTLQPACRRSIPTPRIAFYRLSGISRFAPKRFDGDRYNLNHLDPDETAEVGAVSGSFMMLRKSLLGQIGLFDERFFLYGEDLDICYRAGQAGWKVMYYPGAEVVHLKGRSAKRNRNRAHYEFYRAMYLFHQKHFAQDSPMWLNALIWVGIAGRAFTTWPARWLAP